MEGNGFFNSFKIQAVEFGIGLLINLVATWLIVSQYNFQWRLLAGAIVVLAAFVATILKSKSPGLHHLQSFTYGALVGMFIFMLFIDYHPPPGEDRASDLATPSNLVSPEVETSSEASELAPPEIIYQPTTEPTTLPTTSANKVVFIMTALVSVNARPFPTTKSTPSGFLRPGESAQVLGITPDYKWWWIICPFNLNFSCWVTALPQNTYLSEGDINDVPIVPYPANGDNDTSTPLPSPLATAVQVLPDGPSTNDNQATNTPPVPPTPVPSITASPVAPTLVPSITASPVTPTTLPTTRSTTGPCNQDNRSGGIICTSTPRPTLTPRPTETKYTRTPNP